MSPQIGHFDASAVEPNVPFEPLPPGWYAMMITASEIKDSQKDPNNKYLKLTLQVIDSIHPAHSGRVVWSNLNLWNSNATAVEIAQRDLSAICRAIGKSGVQDNSEELHNVPLAVKLKVRPADGKYEASNDVKGYEPFDNHFSTGGVQQKAAQQFVAQATPQSVAQPAAAPPVAPSTAPPTTAKPPWQS